MTGAVRGFLVGASSVVQALGFLRRQPALWALCAAPLAATLAVFALAVGVYVGFALDPLTAWLGERIAVAPPDAWYEWLWVGPLHALAWALRGILVLAFFGLALVLFVALGSVLASPFLDALSRRIEQLDAGRVIEGGGGWRAALYVVGQEARRVLFLLAGGVVLALIGIVPGGQLPAALGAALWGAFFLPLEYTGFVLDRRGVSFAARRRWLWSHRWPMLGFGSAALLTFLVPLLNFLCLPLLVTAGTRLTLQLRPPEDLGGAASVSGALPR